MSVPRMSLGDRLRRERERRHWTQQYLADLIGVEVLSIIRWEKGQNQPGKYAQQKLVELFGPLETWGAGRTRIWTVPYLRNLYFTGRERVLTRLHTVLSEQTIVAVSQTRAISGLGGIGKTQTALEYAYRYADEYDAVLWVRADARETLVAQLAGLAPLLGLPNHTEADQHRLAKAVKRWLETQAEQVWLLIFDNMEDLALVKEFLPTRGNGAILLTTRLHALGTHLRKIELDTLTLEEGIQFLQARLGGERARGRAAISEAERQAAEQLCTLLDGLPLALDHAAAYIEEQQCGLVEYVSLYQQQRADFLQMRNQIDPEDYPHSVATTWRLSFQRIEQANPVAADLLRALAFLHPDAIPVSLLLQGAAHLGAHLQAVTEQPALLQQAIDLLQRYSLIRHHPRTDLLSIHRLVQAVLQDGLEETARRSWRERVMLAVNTAFPEVAPETWPECERLLPQALQVTKWIAQQQARGEEEGRLLFETAAYLQHRGRYAEAEPLYQRALHLREQQMGPEHPAVATSLNALGWLYRDQGKFAEAEPLCQRALGIWEQQGELEHAQIVSALNNLGISYTSRGKYAEAEPLYLRALAICEQQLGPNHHDTARTLNNVGNLYSFQGNYTEAEPLYLRALDIWEHQLGPQNSRLAYPLHGLGALYHYQGRYAESEPIYLRALSIREQQLGPEHPQVTWLLTGLANLYSEQGKYVEAEPLYQRALGIWEEQTGEMHPESAYPLSGLANLYARQGRYAEAEPLYRRALHIWEEQMGEMHLLIGETLRALAKLQEAQGNHEAARNGYERALAVRKQVLGAASPPTPEARQQLLALLRAIGQYEEVARLKAVLPEQELAKEV